MTPLGDVMDGWSPGIVESSRRVDPWSAAAFAQLIDAPAADLGEGAPLPPLWHWFTLLDHPAQAGIGEDGHPATGPLLPPLPGRRRMFAGGRFEQRAPIPIGGELACRSAVVDITVKNGRSGEMAFVTVRHALTVGGVAVAVEEQDIVYRSEPPGAQRRTIPRPPTGHPAPTGAWQLTVATDPVLLSRFSGLTYNGHRIHYDHRYVTEVELYPGLVVHGPLLALLALELPRRNAPDRTVRGFTYRLVRPAFQPASIIASADLDVDQVAATVGAVGAEPSLTATVTLT